MGATNLVPLRVGADLSDEGSVDGEERVLAIEQFRLSDESDVVTDVVLGVSSDLIDLISVLVGVSSRGFVCRSGKKGKVRDRTFKTRTDGRTDLEPFSPPSSS